LRAGAGFAIMPPVITHRRFAVAFALFGAATLALQAVCLREMLAVFRGSERVVGAALGGWLLLGGIGSALAGAAVVRRRPAGAAWAVGLATLALLGPATVPLIRALPRLAGSDPGLLLPFWTAAAAALAALAPAGLLSGALFALGVRAREDAGGSPAEPGRTAARAYTWESVGSVAGGLALTAALALGLPSNLDAALAAGLCAAVAALVASAGAPGGWRTAAVAVALVLGACLVTPLGRSLDRASLAAAHRGEEIVAARETPSGRVVLASRGNRTSAYVDGRFAGSPEAALAAEEVAHLALLHHPEPARVLVAGGVLAGWVPPVLQHRPGEAELLETDEAMADLLEGRLGWKPGDRGGFVGETAGMGMPPLRERVGSGTPRYTRLHLSFGDPRMRLRASAGAYDVILLPGGAPDTFAQARLASAECFREARAALRPGGVLALPMPGARSFQNRPHRLVLASVRASLRAAFPFVRVASLESGFLFLASDAPLPAAADVARRWADRGIRAREMAPESIGRTVLGAADRRLDEALDAEPGAPATLDLEPVVVGFQAALAEATSDGRVSAWGRLLMEPAGARGSAAALALGIGLALALVSVWTRVPGRGTLDAGRGTMSGLAAFLAGLSGLALEIVWLDGFQVARGALYREVGAMLALFMAGACAGSGAWLRAGRRAGPAAAGAGLLALAALAASAGWILEGARAGSVLLLPAANLATGALVGWTFAAASGLAPGRAGTVYAADLAGAALGSVVTAGLLVPLLGLPLTGAVVALAVAPPAVRVAWAGSTGSFPAARPLAAVASAVVLLTVAAGLDRALEPGAAPAVPPPPPPPREVAMEGRTVMGTVANAALVVPAGTDLGARGLAAAFSAMERVDALMSDYRDDSEAARVRALSPGASATLDPWTAEALDIAARVHRATGGAFDPTIRPAHRLYRFTGREEPFPAPDALARAMEQVGLSRNAFDPVSRRFAPGPGGADLDFGGVGKGYANDRAAEAVADLGIRDALLAVGGEVLALGARIDGHPWRIGLRDPRDRAAVSAEVDAKPGEAFSTSGGYEKYFLRGGVRQPHVLDARTCRPAAGAPESVTVIYRASEDAPPPLGRAGAVADALATGLLVVGPAGAGAVLAAFPGAEAVFLLADPEGGLRAVATPGALPRLRPAAGVAVEPLR
jgi:thiamine biosynthesis lipoprotein